MPFRDRADAGRQLAQAVADRRAADPVVLGLPRGGVPVAYEVARRLEAPLDIVLVRKLGVPSHPELAMGAIGEGGARVLNPDVVAAAAVTETDLRSVEADETVELERRARRFRGDRPRLDFRGRTTIVVDDGIATGATARVACRVVRAHGAGRIVLAAPVAPPGTADAFSDAADDVVFLESPRSFTAISRCYDDFTQTTDDEVRGLLDAAAGRRGEPGEEVRVAAGPTDLPGRLTVPDGSRAVVVFAHGSGSSRNSSRNRAVAAALHRAGFGTLLFDLLTPAEAAEHALVFDVPRLASRLVAATRWLRATLGPAVASVGYFGASTGAAAALWAAAEPGLGVGAVVSRGGRPDLAGERLSLVRPPTLLIVGGHDPGVVALNRAAMSELRGISRLEVVPGASHLFEEPGALEAVADLAGDWFRAHLNGAQGPPVD